MNVTFSEARIVRDDGVWLCVKVNEPAPAREFVLNHKDRLYDCEIKEHREKRSLDANALYWELCGRLARAINRSPEDVYKGHIKDIGNYEILCVQNNAVEVFTRRWCSNHLGRFVETRDSKISGCTTVLAYYGSSDFDKVQMSKLIDNCIQDCKSIGVETWPEDKVSLLKEAWDGA